MGLIFNLFFVLSTLNIDITYSVDIKLSDLEIDKSGLYLILQFVNPLNIEQYPTCQSILNENILNEIKSQYGDPQCIWYSNTKLHIYPSYNAKFDLNQLDPSSIQSISNDMNPYLIIEAPTMINPCSNLTVSAKKTLSMSENSINTKIKTGQSIHKQHRLLHLPYKIMVVVLYNIDGLLIIQLNGTYPPINQY